VNDTDTLIRDRLAAAATFDVATDPPEVRDRVRRRWRRARRQRRAVVALGVVAVAGVAAGAVVILVPDRGGDVTLHVADQPEAATPDGTAERGAIEVAPGPGSPGVPTTLAANQPRFAPATGWEAVEFESGATASNVELGPSSRAGDAPWDTLDRLADGDVVLYASFMPTGEKPVVDAGFPPRELPLSVADATPSALEGKPDHVTDEALQVQANGWNITIHIFYGALAPSPAARAAAQEQLALLEAPTRFPS
jgi:hypothetical protein